MNDSKSHETYKWLIAKSFKPIMDDALAANDTDFAGTLLKVQKLTGNLTVLSLIPVSSHSLLTVTSMGIFDVCPSSSLCFGVGSASGIIGLLLIEIS